MTDLPMIDDATYHNYLLNDPILEELDSSALDSVMGGIYGATTLNGFEVQTHDHPIGSTFRE